MGPCGGSQKKGAGRASAVSVAQCLWFCVTWLACLLCGFISNVILLKYKFS